MPFTKKKNLGRSNKIFTPFTKLEELEKEPVGKQEQELMILLKVYFTA